MTSRDKVLSAVAEFLPTAPATLERLQKNVDLDPVDTRRCLHQLIGAGLVRAHVTPVPYPVRKITTYVLTADGRAALLSGVA